MRRAEYRRNRTAQLDRLDDDAVLCIALVYRAIGLMHPAPTYYDPDVLRAAVVDAECARMAPELTVIDGGLAA